MCVFSLVDSFVCTLHYFAVFSQRDIVNACDKCDSKVCNCIEFTCLSFGTSEITNAEILTKNIVTANAKCL